MGIFNATATYGRGFVATTDPDIYSVRIYTTAFAGPRAADARVAQEIRAFQSARGYSSHLVLSRRRSLLVLSYYEYYVKFSRA